MASLTMADLLKKQDQKNLRVVRNQELEGKIIAITDSELILDLGTKAEGVLPKRDLTSEQLKNIKVGEKLSVFVLLPENESGQVLLTLQKVLGKPASSGARWKRFEEALDSHQVLNGRGLEVNKGGLIVEVGGIRGFLPSSQVSLSTVGDLSELIGKDLQVTVIEVDLNQNRLIFSQKTNVTEEVKTKLSSLKIGDKVKGKVAAVLPFGIFVTIEGEAYNGVEGLVHISELSWQRVEEPGSLFKTGQEVEAKVISVDHETGRVNLSIKQLSEDPFKKLSEKYHPDDVIKGEVIKVSANGVAVKLEEGVEGVIPSSKLDQDSSYEAGEKITVLIDNVDLNKHKINLTPFRTSTKDLIYK